MKKNNELINLQEQLKHLKTTVKDDPYAVREIEELKREIKQLKQTKDGK